MCSSAKASAMARQVRVDAWSQHLGTPSKTSSRKAAAISGPILSIVSPWFGQTGMKSGPDVVDLERFQAKWRPVRVKKAGQIKKAFSSEVETGSR